ncbi:hypothetical protein ACLOJK_016315 [Asimina triloba]
MATATTAAVAAQAAAAAAAAACAAASSPSSLPKKLPAPPSLPPSPWSHLETTNLIDAYQAKWYFLNRGHLKASQWEEVAASLAARCGFNPPSKTATQCRHKIEKLRKRYRSEKQLHRRSSWPYFDPMDQMERGPSQLPSNRDSKGSDEDDDIDANDEDDAGDAAAEDEDANDNSNTRSINHIIHAQPLQAQPILSFVDRSFPRFSRNPRFRKRSSFAGADGEEEEEGAGPLSELAAAVRAFGEGFVKMENMKMEIMRETEKNRMEMERKRTEMILESQRRIAESIAEMFSAQKKAKKSSEKSSDS